MVESTRLSLHGFSTESSCQNSYNLNFHRQHIKVRKAEQRRRIQGLESHSAEKDKVKESHVVAYTILFH